MLADFTLFNPKYGRMTIHTPKTIFGNRIPDATPVVEFNQRVDEPYLYNLVRWTGNMQL
jgi:hypothetical protein